MPYDPRNKYRLEDYDPGYMTMNQQSGGGGGGTPPPDQDQSGGNNPDPSGSNTGAPGTGNDLWSRLMAALKGYGNVDLFEQNRSKLDPFLAQAKSYWGLDDDALMAKVGYNPLKAMYSMNSMLTGTPYYDKGNAEDGSETWKPFYVPGWDYDPNTPGVQAPSWIKNPYDPASHAFRT